MNRTIWHECGSYKEKLVDMLSPKHKANDVHLKTSLNDSGQLDLNIPPSNPESEMLCAMASEIVVYEDDTELFRGRVTGNERDTYGFRHVSAKGLLDYLHDTILPFGTYTGTSRKVINDLMYEHAKKDIERWKVFNLGTIDVAGTITIEVKSQMTVWDAIKQLVKDYKGYVSAYRVNGVNIIDWVEDITHVCSQRIEIGDNIVSIRDSIKTETLCTVMYGYGKNNLTFSNNGKPYVKDDNAVATFGWIEGTYQNSSCEDADQLLADTTKALKDRIADVRNVELKAADLADIRDDSERLQVGYMVPCRLPGSDADENLRLKELDWYPFEPKRTAMSVGTSMNTLTNLIGGR